MKRLFCLFVLLVVTTAARALPSSKPNIIIILTDDTGYGDLSAHGHPLLKTPNIDRLHREGARFTDFHVSPTCSPTRSALLTGRHEFKNGVTHTILERERLTLNAVTFPQLLQKQGYKTGIFGKWHLGDEDPYQPGQRGFDEVFIHGGGGIGQIYPGSCGDAPDNKYFSPVIRHNGRFERTEGFCTDVFTTQALRWMESVPKSTPFFCYLPYNAAHEPVSCPDADKAAYESKAPGKLPIYFGMIANIDTNVGRVLNWLDQTGRTENTLVIFMNDNGVYGPAGQFYNAGMRGTKASPWIGGTRAASLWRWPGVIKPRDISGITAHIDVFPTFAELTKAPLDPKTLAQVDGKSLLPLLENNSVPWPERTMVTHVGRWPKGENPQLYRFSQCSIRSGSWHMVWAKPGQNPDGENGELFDLSKDPGEINRVTNEHPEVVKKLKEDVVKWWKEVTPYLVNEKAEGPDINPYQEAYYKQFGGKPTEEALQRMHHSSPLQTPKR
jgi:arylsulfatase